MAFQLLQVSGDSFAACPDSANLSIADNLDLRIRVIIERLASGGIQTFLSKRQGGDEWQWRLSAAGGNQFVWWDTGGTPTTEVSSVDLSTVYTEGTTIWLRVDRSGTSVDFYYSEDATNDHTAVSWTALGVTQTTPAGSIRSNVATHVHVGASNAGGDESLIGFIHAAAVVDNVTTRADPVFASSAEWTVGEDSGDTGSDGTNTWTLGGGARIVGDNVQGAYLSVQSSFGSDPFFDQPIWTDLTDDMRAVSFSRGRQYELDRINAGTMSVTLSNAAGQYNAHNTAGAYYPDIRPMVPIRLRAVYDGTVYPLWQGFVERWPVSFPAHVDSIVTVECVDLFKALTLADASQPDRTTAVEALSPVAWWRFGSTTDEVGGHDLTFAGSPTAGGASGVPWTNDEATTFDGTDDAATVDNEADVERQGLDRSYEFWVRPTGNDANIEYILNIGSAIRVGWFGSHDQVRVLAGVADPFIDVAVSEDEWHHIVVTDDRGTSTYLRRVYVDGVLAGTAAAVPDNTGTFTVYIGRDPGGSPVNHFAGDISEIAVYPTALTADQVQGLFIAQFEAYATERTDQRIAYVLSDSAIGLGAEYTFTDLEEGQTTISGPNSPTDVTALEAIQVAADTEFGQFFMTGDGTARFHDRHYRLLNQNTAIDSFNPTDLPYTSVVINFDDELVANDIRVSPSSGAADFIAQDEDSIASYGRRTLSKTVYPDDQNEAYDFAQYLKSLYAEPDTRIESIMFRMGMNTDLWPIILAGELGNRYNVLVPLAGDDLNQDVHLEAITHTITANKVWDVTWQLSPASSATFWLLGVAGSSELGETTVLGY